MAIIIIVLRHALYPEKLSQESIPMSSGKIGSLRMHDKPFIKKRVIMHYINWPNSGL